MTEPRALVVAAHRWQTNSDLITEACLPLGYVHPDWLTLDPTYGEGNWWTRFRPRDLRAHDEDPDKSPLEPADFRRLPYPSNMFRVVTYDPPYVSVGGRATSTIPDTYNRYGLMNAPKTPAGLQELMDEGCTEQARLLAVTSARHPSYLLYKAQNYISNGSFWDGIYRSVEHAKKLGLRQVDQFEMLGKPGAQPKRSTCLICARAIQRSTEGPWCDYGTPASPTCVPSLLIEPGTEHKPDPAATVQDHAARNLSTLLVFEKPKASTTVVAEPPPALF